MTNATKSCIIIVAFTITAIYSNFNAFCRLERAVLLYLAAVKKWNAGVMKKLFNLIFSRMFIFGMLILFQVVLLVLLLVFISDNFSNIYLILSLLSFVVAVYIIVKKGNPMYKIAWLFPVLLIPVLGGAIYLLFGQNRIDKKLRARLNFLIDKSDGLIGTDEDIVSELKEQSLTAYRNVKYLSNVCKLPVWKNTEATFLTPGERKHIFLVDELKKAKRFIFLEYFIIEKGVMWDSILAVLIEKVKEGVDVRVLYDDLGCISTLPPHYNTVLEGYGIKTKVFNPFKPSLDMFMNNRDHRKIAVIDGNVGFTGGINLADEYINEYAKHGYWKDASVMLKGDAVFNLTIIFLRLWGIDDADANEDIYQYRPTLSVKSDGYIMPFDDSPLDSEQVGESAYMNLINTAKDYIYITTPYLIIDNEMMVSLKLAAASGVLVYIVTPFFADKWFVHEVTRSTYNELIEAGVKIYEYTPGFIHSKTIVCDDRFAMVGTTNFDYRSFYLHFECGCFIYNSPAVMQVKYDYEDILAKSTRMDISYPSAFKRLVRTILKVFSPLM